MSTIQGIVSALSGEDEVVSVNVDEQLQWDDMQVQSDKESCLDLWAEDEAELEWAYEENFWSADQKRNDHFRTCVWSDPNATCGPDTCECCFIRPEGRQVWTSRGLISEPADPRWKDRQSVGKLQTAAKKVGKNSVSEHYANRVRKFRKNMSFVCAYVLEHPELGHLTEGDVEAYILAGAPGLGFNHCCVFGYRNGNASDCSWCPSLGWDRTRLCAASRFCSSYLRWSRKAETLELGLVEETMDSEKKRGARKYDKVKAQQKYFAGRSTMKHDPYWKSPSQEEVLQWSVSERASECFRKACKLRFNKQGKNDVCSLNEAVQCMFLFEPPLYDNKGLGCPKDLDRHQVDVLKRLDEKTKYRQQRGFGSFPWKREDPKFDDTWVATFQCLVRKNANYIQQGCSVLDAYKRCMYDIFSVDRGMCVVNKEYEWMSARGVLNFLAAVKQIGLYDGDDYPEVVHDAVNECFQSFKYVNECDARTVQKIEDGTWMQDEALSEAASDAGKVLSWRLNYMRSIMERFRLPGKIDYHLMSPEHFWPSCVHEYVCKFRRPDQANKCTHLYGRYSPTFLRKLQLVDVTHLGVCEETMMSASLAQAGEKLLCDEKARGGMSDVIAQAMDPHFVKMTDCIEQMVGFGRNAMLDSKVVMEKTNKLMESMNGFFEKINPIVSRVGPMIESVCEKVDATATWVEMFLNNLKKLVPGAESFGGLPSEWLNNLDVKSVLMIVDSYISYVNCSSKSVRAYCIIKCLYALGLLHKVADACIWAFQQVKEYFVQETDDTSTETTWWEMLATAFDSIDVKKASWFAGMFVVLLCGTKIPFKSMHKIGKDIMSMLTNMHFVGLGLFGGKRIFEYLHSILVCVVDWMRTNIFALPDKKNEDVGVVAKWAARVKFFISEAGIRTMKLSKTALDEAADLYPRGVEYYIRSQREESWIGRDMTRMVAMMLKDALTISNVIHRIKTYTNFRPTMFHIQFVGKPGIGKSTLTTAVIAHLKEALFPSLPDDNLVYALNDCEYFDGYNGQTFVVGDDLWKYNEAKHGTAIIGLITNTPVQLPQSHLEDKGQYLDSEIMISSVNDPYFRFKDVVDQNAIWRRRHVLVHVDIDHDVMDPSTHKFDMGLFQQKYKGKSPKEFPHLKFNMLKPVPNPTDPYEVETIINPVSHITPEMKCRAGEYKECDPMPKGFSKPLVELNFEQVLQKCESRYRAMRAEEKTILPNQKKALMDQNWVEIDDAIDSAFGGNPPSRFLQGLFMPPEVDMTPEEPAQNEVEQQLSECVYEVCVQQEFGSLNVGYDQLEPDNIMGDTASRIGLCEETMDDAQSFVTADSEPELSAEAESRRRQRILRQRGRNEPQPQQLDERNDDPSTGLVTIEGKRFMKISSSYKPEDQMYNRSPQGPYFEEWKKQGKDGVNNLVGFIRWQANLRTAYESLGDESIEAIHDSRRLKIRPSDTVSAAFAQRASRMRWEFLRRCHEIDGQWYFSLDHLERARMLSDRVWNKLNSLQKENLLQDAEARGYSMNDMFVYESENEICSVHISSVVLANSDVYDQFCLFCDEFNNEQRQIMTNATKNVIRRFGRQVWRKIATENVRTWVNEKLAKIRRFGMWFWDTFIRNERWVTSCVAAFMVVAVGAQIGALFVPQPAYETSKVLFKARESRPLLGKFTDAQSTGQQVESLMRRNLTKLSIEGRTFTGVKSGQYIYTVKHALRKVMRENQPFELTLLPSVYSVDEWTVVVQPKQVAMVESSDFAVIYCPNLPSARCIDEWFVLDAELQSLRDDEVVFMYMDSHGTPVVMMKKPKRLETSVHMIARDGYEGVHKWMISMEALAVPGSSGGPVMTSGNVIGARRIFGLQSLNKDPWSYAQGVSQEMLREAKEMIKYDRTPVIDEGPLFCDETVRPSMEDYVQEHLDVAGYVPTNCRAGAFGETKFVKTPFAEVIKTDHVPAILSRRHPRARELGQHPLAHSINKFGRDVMTSLPEQHLQKAVRDVARYISNKIGNPKLRLMELEEIVLGHDHPGSGPMNLSTSPGLPYTLMTRNAKGKRTWVDTNPDGEIEKLDESVVQELIDTEEAMAHGVIPPCSMYEFAKDELRPKTKAYGGLDAPIKTRSISVMNMVHAMLFRRFHLDLTSHMHVNADGDFQSCVGINPEGPEWMRMFQNLRNKSAVNCFDLDVGNWDGHFTPQLFFAVVKTVNKVYGCEEDSEESSVRYSLAHAALFGYDQIEDMVFKKMRGMPSGFGGTAIYNTIGHMLVFYVFWLLCCERQNKQAYANFNAYLAFVCVYFYGDDVIASVSEDVCEWFNVNTVAALYEEFGWPTTSAAKGSGMGSADIFSVQFLKRKFVLDEELGQQCVHGQIDQSVINNLLVWMRRNARTVDKQQMIENVHNAAQFQFAYGRDAYAAFFRQVNEVLSEFGYSNYYIDYDDMRDCMLVERFGIISA